MLILDHILKFVSSVVLILIGLNLPRSFFTEGFGTKHSVRVVAMVIGIICLLNAVLGLF
jgi:uncharacterized membrane protein (Fun14 family)